METPGVTSDGPWVAGVDSSTQATKVTIVDAWTGAVVATGRAPHQVIGTGGARETDPDDWWSALGGALAQTGIASRVAAISVAAQQHGLCVLDSAGRPLRRAFLWNDTRSAPEAAELVEALGGRARCASLVGSVPVASFTVTSWMWLRRRDPALARDVAAVRLPHDFLTERLCGEGVTDRGDASGTGWWSPTAGDYVDEVLELPQVALERRLLPALREPTNVVGYVSRAATAATGLTQGIPVAVGTGDNMAAALVLSHSPQDPVLSLGTSGTVYRMAEEPVSDASGIVAGFADASGRYLPLACTLNATRAVETTAGWLGLDREQVLPSASVVMNPYFDGERTPDLPRAAATVTGLRHETRPEQILMAAYEGVVASLLEALSDVERLCGAPDSTSSPIRLVGGGAMGAGWRETVARLSGRTVVVPSETELVARGAALQAASAVLERDPLDLAATWRRRPTIELKARPPDREKLEQIRAARRALAAIDADPPAQGAGR